MTIFAAATGPVCEDPNERRADVKATGAIRHAGNIDPQCPGHLGESTPTDASNPVTEKERPESAASASLPILRLSSRWSTVIAFQANQGLAADGIVGPKAWARLLSQP